MQQKDYDRISNQSVVTAENLHMWPEVSLDGWHWLPVEPTPGYPVPYSHQTWWQWLQARAGGCIGWIRDNPFKTISALLFGSLLIVYRRECFSWLSWLVWLVAFLLFPAKRLKYTRQLIDVRFWVAGLPRPAFAPISCWFSQVDNEIDARFFQFWRTESYCTNPRTQLPGKEIVAACQEIEAKLSFQKIKRFAKHLTK